MTTTRPPQVTLSAENLARLRTYPRPPQDNGIALPPPPGGEQLQNVRSRGWAHRNGRCASRCPPRKPGVGGRRFG